MISAVRFRHFFIVLSLLATFTSAFGQRLIDENDRIVLSGDVPPQARAASDAGLVDSAFAMRHMILALKPRGRSADLDAFIAAQYDPNSPQFHHWLTPAQFAQRFGPADNDLADVMRWLQKHGLVVDEIAAGRGSITFSGTAAQVEDAFRTSMHEYVLNGQDHHANATPPSIPRALGDVVMGVVSLHDFYKAPQHVVADSAPQYTSGSNHQLAPADFATIYDVNPLYAAGTNGAGQKIAIVGRTDIHLADVQTFRSYFGLPANDPQIIHNGADPGDLGGGEETEADLDVQWSGAVAKNATVLFVVSASTSTTDGVDLSAQYIVNNNLAPVMSTSFGACESALGPTAMSFYNNLWAQAAAEGITAFVSSGDSGAAGCDSGSASTGTGAAVNGLCSSAYSVCVGGTQFSDTSSPSTYWLSSNDPSTKSSVLSYIPEKVWNQSGSNGGSGLWASGGGASIVFSKPSWQVAPGVPNDGARDVPDVSLSAATHDAYLVVRGGSLFGVGGTSAASPSFAGLMALVVQSTGSPQGNANTNFYRLGANQYASGGPAVFHDTTTGNNTVPGVTGFAAIAGYDQSTGLGSVDANSMVANWSPTPNPYSLSIVSSANPSQYERSVTFSATVTSNNGVAPAGNVTFFDGSAALGTSPLVGNTATYSTASLSVGAHSISAVYSASGSTASTGLTEQITKATSTTTVTGAPNPSVLAQSVTFTATVSSTGTIPDGETVTFKNGSTVLGTGTTAGGVASLATSSLPAGSLTISAVYAGDSHFATSTGTVKQTVNKYATTTTVTTSLNPSLIQQAVTFTAVVSSTMGAIPDGETVTFKKSTTVLGTGTTAAGTASFTTSALPAGSLTISAVYAGDSHFASSTGTVKQTVNKYPTTTTVTTSLTPSLLQQAVTFTATVSSTMGAIPDGETVTFKNGSTALGTGTMVAGTASFTTSSLPAGSLTISAVYAGDSTFATSTGTVKQTVKKYTTTTALTSSLNPAPAGQPVTFTAAVSSTMGAIPDGEAVTFKSGTTLLGTGTLSSGTASVTVSTLPTGSNTITATYSGDANFASSKATLTETVQ